MTPRDELAGLDATEQAALVRRGDVTASELVDAAIERIEALNPTLNAVITPTFDPINQTIVALPIILLFEVGILLSRLAR